MNITFDAKRFFHNNRGLGNYSRDVVRLLTTYYPDNSYFLLNPKKKKNSIYIPPQGSKEITPNNFYKYFPQLWRSKGCIRDIKKIRTDIYHGLSQELPQGIHKTGIKTVVTMHDAIFIRYPELYDSFYRKLFIKKNQYSCKVADKIIAISEQTRNDFIEFFNVNPEKIEVVYQGCNNIFREKIEEGKLLETKQKYQLPDNFILFVGAIEKRKNIETIIKALSIGSIDISLVILGRETKYKEELKELIIKLGIEKQVIFLQNVPTNDLPSIYKLADLFIYPSVFEGFGIPILEALCTGTPVITSKDSCFKETGGSAAIYVNYNNAEEMAYEIERVLNNRELSENMIREGFIHTGNFTDDKIAYNLMNVYRDLNGEN